MNNTKKTKKILIVRTDRLGDVVLSTPVIECVRDWAPEAHIAFLCRPYTREVVEHNPYLNEVLSYDKYGRHRGWLSTIRFARELKKKKFDCAIILHATNRVNVLCWLARIPKRVGWNRKKGFLLTHKVSYIKREGTKHEMEYAFDILKAAGIPVTTEKLSLVVPDETQFKTKKRLIEYGFTRGFIAIHPGASSPSKIWPLTRFSELIDDIYRVKNLPVIVVGGKDEKKLGEELAEGRESFVKDCTGIFSVSELAAVLKESCALVSNDSGPVHVACALGTPVIAIFGRKMTGLGPKMWGPVTENSTVLQHDVGCQVCLADDCDKNFACLEAVSVNEVMKALERLINQ